MANSQTTIELNGVRYDARTGQVLSQKNFDNISSEPVKPNTPHESQQVLDNFIRQSKDQPKHFASSLQSRKVRQPANVNQTKRKLAKSNTLMRPSLKKPTIKNNIAEIKKTTKVIGIGNSISRQKRAEASIKSPNISRFAHMRPRHAVVKKHQPLEVVRPSNTPQNIIQQTNNFVNSELEQIENALLNANSHLQQLEDSVIKKMPILNRIGLKNRFANIAAMSFAFALLIGFFVYQNSAIISMKMAASKSGISANLPGYRPAGYSVGNIQSSPGSVNIAFKSNSSGNEFQLTQTASNWNSSTLLSDQVLKEQCASCYQTYQANGKTIYIYDNSNATWVNSGIIYKIGGNTQLSSDQIIRLANSL